MKEVPDVEQLLSGIDRSKLSEWEQGFITSISDQWKRNHRLSDKQTKRLREIKGKMNADPKTTNGPNRRPGA